MMRTSFWEQLDYRLARILALGWMAMIFALSSQSTLPVPNGFDGQDKIMHFIGYGILGFFLAKSPKPSTLPMSAKHVLVVVAIVALYGLSDEFHQSFVPGREASLADLLADAIGGLAGALLARSMTKNGI